MIRTPLLLLALTVPIPALAQEPPPPRISVTGQGSVFTPPDLAVIGYSVHGEGAGSDDAVRAMEAKRRAIDAGLKGRVETLGRGGEVSIREVRSRDCNAGSYGPPTLNTGACAITGYVADLSLEIRTRNVVQAATLAGMIGKLGGTNPRVASYRLADPRTAQQRAVAAALNDARTRAQAVAAGSGVTLGALYFASDTGTGPTPDEIIVTASAPPPPPPPPPPEMVSVDATPRPIESNARVSAIYLIAR